MKALIVDDSISVRKALERILNSNDIASEAVSSAEEALESVANLDVNIVIADVVMPGMNGFELCQELKSGTFAHLPVLLISGIVDQEAEAKAKEAGAEGIVKKPFTPDDLIPQIKQAIDNAQTLPATDNDLLITEPAVATTEPTQTQAQEPAPEQLAGLMTHPSILAASLIEIYTGEVIAAEGKLEKDINSLAHYAKTLTSIASVMGESLELNALGSLQLHFEDMSFVTTRVNQSQVLLLCLEDDSSMGIVHYLIHKYLNQSKELELSS